MVVFCLNFTVIIKIRTNDSHLWSCVCYYQTLALYNKRSLQSNHICKFGKFPLCVQSAVILIHRSHLRLASTNLDDLPRGIGHKAVVNHPGYGSYKTKQVKSLINHLPSCPKRAV